MKSKRETYIASNRGKGILIIRTKKTPIKKFGSTCTVIFWEAYSADLKYPVKSYFPTVVTKLYGHSKDEKTIGIK